METTENWKDISGYRGEYKISNLGNVLSMKPWNGKPVPRSIYSVTTQKGWKQVRLYMNGKCKTRLVHKLVEENFS